MNVGEEDVGEDNFDLNMNQLEVRSIKSNSHSKSETPTQNFQINYDKLQTNMNQRKNAF